MKCYQEFATTESESLDAPGMSLGPRSAEIYCVIMGVIRGLTCFICDDTQEANLTHVVYSSHGSAKDWGCPWLPSWHYTPFFFFEENVLECKEQS